MVIIIWLVYAIISFVMRSQCLAVVHIYIGKQIKEIPKHHTYYHSDIINVEVWPSFIQERMVFRIVTVFLSTIVYSGKIAKQLEI